MLYKTILDILSKWKKKSTITGFEPVPTARKPSMITTWPGDLFWNCMQFMGLLCRAYTQWTIHRTVHNEKSSCSLFSTKWTNLWYWICDKQASFILTGYLFKEINRIKGIFERFTVVKWKKKWYDSLNLFPFTEGEPLKKCYVVICLCWNMVHRYKTYQYITNSLTWQFNKW